mgnify:CR=1 FL=1
MGLSFSQDTKRTVGSFDDGSGLIYSNDIADNDLSLYELILNSIDNLISINTKYEYKKALKSILEDYSSNGISTMLEDKNEDSVTGKIENSFGCSSVYAKRIYNQLKNRIKYKYAGLYSINDELTNKVNILTPTFLTSFDILKSRIEYVLKRDWLLNDSTLNELKSRLSEFNVKEDYYEEYKKDLTETISEYFQVNIYETDDEIYFDAIEFLKHLYIEECNRDLNHKNTLYKYEFTTEFAQNNFKNKADAVDYIYAHNIIDLRIEKPDNVQEIFDEEEAAEHFHQLHNAPIDPETYNDTSLKHEVRETASSINTQWNSFYSGLLDGIISVNQENNEYFKLHNLANALLNEHEVLMKNEVFLKSGAINEYSKYLQSLRQELLVEFKSIDNDEKHQKVSKIIGIKKREWKLLNDTINTYDHIFYAFQDLNYKTLEF